MDCCWTNRASRLSLYFVFVGKTWTAWHRWEFSPIHPIHQQWDVVYDDIHRYRDPMWQISMNKRNTGRFVHSYFSRLLWRHLSGDGGVSRRDLMAETWLSSRFIFSSYTLKLVLVVVIINSAEFKRVLRMEDMEVPLWSFPRRHLDSPLFRTG